MNAIDWKLVFQKYWWILAAGGIAWMISRTSDSDSDYENLGFAPTLSEYDPIEVAQGMKQELNQHPEFPARYVSQIVADRLDKGHSYRNISDKEIKVDSNEELGVDQDET